MHPKVQRYQIPGSDAMGSYKPLDVSAGDRTQLLRKSSVCSEISLQPLNATISCLFYLSCGLNTNLCILPVRSGDITIK